MSADESVFYYWYERHSKVVTCKRSPERMAGGHGGNYVFIEFFTAEDYADANLGRRPSFNYLTMGVHERDLKPLTELEVLARMAQ